MTLSLRTFFVLFLVAALPPWSPASAQQAVDLSEPFLAEGLSIQDRRFLQAALAFEGALDAPIAPDWSPGAQDAMDDFAQTAYGAAPSVLHMAALAQEMTDRAARDGWTWRHFDSLGLSLLFPSKTAVPAAPDGAFTVWDHSTSSLRYRFASLSRPEAQALHRDTLALQAEGGTPVRTRDASLAVTGITGADGTLRRVRSDYIDGAWSTVVLSADAADGALLGAVAASIAPGLAAPLAVTRGGRLDRARQAAAPLLDTLERLPRDRPAPPTEATPPAVTPPEATLPDVNLPEDSAHRDRPSRPFRAASTGSGFYVSAEGHVLTNAHVADGCTTIHVDGLPARLLTQSADSDLALLLSEAPAPAVAIFSEAPARLNSDVTALGYPLSHILGGMNVTRGSVSAINGLSGDPATMQITAPVQPGNSGGPLIGADGSVVGVVVAKLDALTIADQLRDIPQNVNFAVRAEVAARFLAAQGVSPLRAAPHTPLRPEDLAQRAAAFTAFVECDPR